MFMSNHKLIKLLQCTQIEFGGHVGSGGLVVSVKVSCLIAHGYDSY